MKPIQPFFEPTQEQIERAVLETEVEIDLADERAVLEEMRGVSEQAQARCARLRERIERIERIEQGC